MVDLSILIPGIRPHRWTRVVKSIEDAFGGSFEVIFVGPTANYNVINDRRTRFIQDYGSPARCQQIALLFAQGKYCCAMADDGYFLKGMLDKIWQEKEGYDVISSYYHEGASIDMDKEHYYKIWSAPAMRAKYINPDWWIFNIGLIKTSLLRQYGGWDSEFEVTAISHADLACRLQSKGTDIYGDLWKPAKLKMFKEAIAKFEHMPNITGDHAPVHFAHTEFAEHRFREIWNNCGTNRIEIDINNWASEPYIWKRRFQ